MGPEIVKTQTKRYQVKGVALDFLAYNETFRNVRSGMSYKGSACFNCIRPFDDGEKMSLLFFTNYGNRLVCRECGLKFQAALAMAEKGADL